MTVINMSWNELLYFMNDQDSPKNNKPITRNVFSLELKLTTSLKKSLPFFLYALGNPL